MLSTIPAGLQTGGTSNKTPSGYSDQLLTGRWAFPGTPAGETCVDIPLQICTGGAISFAPTIGYVANGNSATEIFESSYFRGEACQAGNIVATTRFARDITFDAADTSINDQTVTPAGQIAVRRGLFSNERSNFTAGDANAINELFASCAQFNPNPTTPDETTPQACTSFVQLRIESGAGGAPVLLTDENSACIPGTVPPPAAFGGDWTQTLDDGAIKLP